MKFKLVVYKRDIKVREKNYIINSHSSCSGILSLKAIERIDLQVLNKAVELFLGIFILILLSADSNSDLSGYVSDAINPQIPVKTGIDTHILY